MAGEAFRRLLRATGLEGAARTVRHPVDGVRAAAARRWARQRFRPSAELARALDPSLWDEAQRFAADLEQRHRSEFERLRRTIRLGGGADHRLLYFLTRLTRPTVVVETGVAAGWSSAAVLAALERNQHGHLWSSELVYDRPWLHADYRPYVGMVVDEALKDRWTLLLDGDRANLPRILDTCGPVDLFHFDSDKTVAGREFAFSIVGPQFADGTVVVVDDIADNLHFRDLTVRMGRPSMVAGSRATVGIIWDGLPTTDG